VGWAGPDFNDERQGKEKCRGNGSREAGLGLGVLRSVKTGLLRGRGKHRTLKTRLAIAFGGGQAYFVGGAGVHDGNSGESKELLIMLWPDADAQIGNSG
jgi:hypothetical protein